MTTIEKLLEEVFSVGFALKLYSKDLRQCSSVDSQAVKRRLVGWCEMTASLGASSLKASL
jgi:hypothetical protein